MIRLSRLADYSVVIMSRIAQAPERWHTATELAASTALPVATVSKVLKLQAHGGLLASHRGAKGGYTLAKAADRLSVGAIIAAVDGPIALTDCSDNAPGSCELETLCPTRTNWQKINQAIREALQGVTLADMAPELGSETGKQSAA